ncbi:MAG: hypothetical protein M1834_000362 [Cirrosporium novae-zelandiae]|nr:MAG: hypothetical protein M1834_000362 [Cirrosporium novae-zelandiae]
MGGPNLEVFKFGMYIMFPIGWMYYFGTNLENRFTVPDFWPKNQETHKIPFEKDDIHAELERLKRRRLENRARRLATEGKEEGDVLQLHQVQSEKMGMTTPSETSNSKQNSKGGWMSRLFW